MPKVPLSPYHRFARTFAGCVAFIFLSAFIVNTVVNPLWVSPAPWTDPAFSEYKPIHKQPRTGKAGLAMQGGLEAVIIGSSRVDIALDPNDPLWGGAKVANLGLRGGNLCEFAPLLRLAAEHNPLRIVILGVDHYDLTSPILIPNVTAFNESPLAPTSDPLERKIRYYVGGSTTTYSIKAINYRAEGRLASYDRHGQWVESLDARPFRSIFRTDSLPQAVEWIRRSRASHAAVPEKIDALRSIIDVCRSHGIRLVILIPPNHATYLSTFFAADAPDPTFDINRRLIFQALGASDRELVNAPPVPVWDFCDFHPLNCETLPPADQPRKMNHWIDGTHATTSLGSLMLNCALRDEAAVGTREGIPYGTRLTPTELDIRTAAVRAGFERYRQTNPDDFAWAVRLYLEATSP